MALLRAVALSLAAVWLLVEGVFALGEGREPVFLRLEVDWLQYALLLLLVGLLTWAAVRRCLALRRRGKRGKGEEAP